MATPRRRRFRRAAAVRAAAVRAEAAPERAEMELLAADVEREPPLVRLGPSEGERSIAPTVYALLDRGAAMRPALAAQMRGTVLLRFSEGYHLVRIDFRGDQILVGDAPAESDHAADLVVTGALPDVVTVIAAPLAGGLPRPTHKRGRAALARLADGRVDFEGPLALARRLVKLMAIEPEG